MASSPIHPNFVPSSPNGPPSLSMKTLLFALALSTAGLCLAEDKPAPWKAGAASVVVTPETNLWMAGYAARKKPAEAKVQDLFAKAIALQDEEGQKLVIVTMD